MKRNASFLIIVFVVILVLVTLRASAQTTEDGCRIDISMKNTAALDQDITEYIDDIVSKGYKTVSVYGFASIDEEESTALSRSQSSADLIAKKSNSKINAIPQFGVDGGTTNIFGPSIENKRIIISTSQLLQSEYVPGKPFGQYDPDSCPVVFHCERAKLYRGSWYCLKIENNANIWYGPCENDNCIGDTDFTVVPRRRQTELNNVIGDDPVSLNNMITELLRIGDFQMMDGSALKALESYQEALEISLELEPTDRIKTLEFIKNLREVAFSNAVLTVKKEKDAQKILSLVRRSEKLSSGHPIIINPEKKAMLESIEDKISNTAYYAIIIIIITIAIIALASLIHLLLHTKRSHKIAHGKILDEAAEEIIDDIEKLELSFKKKAMLVEDDIQKLKSLK